ncbi:MAG: hypothetical protein WCQ21_37115 [Verrucomicrobiota bacterium]
MKMKEQYRPETAHSQMFGRLDRLGLKEGWLAVFDLDPAVSWDSKLTWRNFEFEAKTLHLVFCRKALSVSHARFAGSVAVERRRAVARFRRTVRLALTTYRRHCRARRVILFRILFVSVDGAFARSLIGSTLRCYRSDLRIRAAIQAAVGASASKRSGHFGWVGETRFRLG